jgi:hypothetical protein
LSAARLVRRTGALTRETLGGQFNVPVFVIQGAENDRTPASFATSFVNAIRHRGRVCDNRSRWPLRRLHAFGYVSYRPVGVLTLADWGDEMHLVWMAILPEMQRQGLGGASIEHSPHTIGCEPHLQLQHEPHSGAGHIGENDLRLSVDMAVGPYEG